MKKIVSVFIVLFFSAEISAQEIFNKIDISAGIEKMKGHTTYQIGGDIESTEGSGTIHFPLSELIFPLDVYMMSLDSDVYLLNDFKVNAGIKKNITDDTGKMKDSDWGVPFEIPFEHSGDYYWYGPDHKDIYSESNTKLNALIADVSFMYNIINIKSNSSDYSISFFGGMGYLYQSYKFKCYLIKQWDLRPDVPDDQNMTVTGTGGVALRYEVFSNIPYANIEAELAVKEKYFLNARFGYSPYTKVNDKDNHILRSKISKAKCDGDAIIASCSVAAYLDENFYVKLNFDYLKVETKGREKQYDNGVWSATIDQKNFSERQSFGLAAGYSF